MSTRFHLVQYCLRALGAPVVEINVSPEQIDDRIDEALSFWNLNHFEGIERTYLSHKITCSSLDITGTNAADFVLGTTLTGQTTGATGTVQKNLVNNKIRIRDVTGVFQAGEVVSNGTATAALPYTTTFYVPGDTENRYIPIPDAVFGISRVLPFTQISSSQNLFDVQYQLLLNDMRNLTSTDLTYYVQSMSHLGLLQSTLNAVPDFEFNRQQGRLILDVNWKSKLQTDQFIVLEAYRALDPNSFTKVWSEPWLRLYTTALIKRQWGTNLKLFSGVKLPGGVTVDGNVIFQEAAIEIKALEEELLTKSAPLSFFMG